MRPYHLDAAPLQSRRTAPIAAARAIVLPRPPQPLPLGRDRASGVVHAVVALVALWRRRSRERQQLARLDARLLRDIGITPCEAAAECDKPFWRG